MKTITATVNLSEDQSIPFAYYEEALEQAFDEVKDKVYLVEEKNDRMMGFDCLQNGTLAIDEVTIGGDEYLPEEIQDEFFAEAFPTLEKTTVNAKGDSQSDWQEFAIYNKKGADLKDLIDLLDHAMTGTEEEYFITITETLESGHSKEIDGFATTVGINQSTDEKKRKIADCITDQFPDLKEIDARLAIDFKNIY